GHRVFRLGDPRATLLRQALERLGDSLGPGIGRLAFAAEVERAVGAAFARLKPGRPPLQTNVEINAALLLDAVGLPREAFTPVLGDDLLRNLWDGVEVDAVVCRPRRASRQGTVAA